MTKGEIYSRNKCDRGTSYMCVHSVIAEELPYCLNKFIRVNSTSDEKLPYCLNNLILNHITWLFKEQRINPSQLEAFKSLIPSKAVIISSLNTVLVSCSCFSLFNFGPLFITPVMTLGSCGTACPRSSLSKPIISSFNCSSKIYKVLQASILHMCKKYDVFQFPQTLTIALLIFAALPLYNKAPFIYLLLIVFYRATKSWTWDEFLILSWISYKLSLRCCTLSATPLNSLVLSCIISCFTFFSFFHTTFNIPYCSFGTHPLLTLCRKSECEAKQLKNFKELGHLVTVAPIITLRGWSNEAGFITATSDWSMFSIHVALITTQSSLLPTWPLDYV